MVKGRRWVLKQHFVGEPKPEDFELVEEELPALRDNEIQYRSLFLSVDPYMRPYTMRMSPPFTMIGSSVAVVEETRQIQIQIIWNDIIVWSPQEPKVLCWSDHHNPGWLGWAGRGQPRQDGPWLPREHAGRDHARPRARPTEQVSPAGQLRDAGQHRLLRPAGALSAKGRGDRGRVRGCGGSRQSRGTDC